MSTKVLVSAFIFFMAVSAKAEEHKFDVQTLVGFCKSESNASDFGICIGFIVGVTDSLVMAGQAPQYTIFSACPKNTLTNKAWIQVFINWAERHPEHWSMPAVVGATMAIQEMAPCKKIN